jgi:hypothetical protein
MRKTAYRKGEQGVNKNGERKKERKKEDKLHKAKTNFDWKEGT